MIRFLTILLLSMFTIANAQTVIFSQDFEDENMEGWLLMDNDGDGINWELVYSSDQAAGQGWGPDMSLMLASFAYNMFPGQEAPLTPDNLLITPAIELPEGSPVMLDFKVGTNVEFMNNHNFALYVTEDYTTWDASDTPYFEMNFEGISTAQQVNMDISGYAGSSVYLIFRHYNSDAQFALMLDDILITAGSMSVRDAEAARFAVYPNPTADLIHIDSADDIQKYELFNVSGAKILEGGSTERISLAQMPKGVYFLKIHTAETVFTQKVIRK